MFLVLSTMASLGDYVVRNGFIDDESESVEVHFHKLVAELSPESVAAIWSRTENAWSEHKREQPTWRKNMFLSEELPDEVPETWGQEKN